MVGTLVAMSAPAHAGGMFLPTRGVRATARAGAFVAGIDDVGAIGFNPAGLAHRAGGNNKKQAYIDFGFVAQDVTYTREDSGNNLLEPVTNEAPGLPIPTIGVAFDVAPDVVVAAGVFAPYASLGKYPADGGQRYSLIDMSESVLAVVEVSVGWRVNDGLRLGAGIQNMVSHVASTLVFSGCPGETLCGPEDPEFDSLGQIQQTDLFSPSGIVGVQLDLGDSVTVGASVQLPFRVAGKGKLTTKLPDSGFYASAEVVGDEGSMAMTLPAIVRAGVQVRPAKHWAVELDVDYEMWSMQESLEIEPDNVRIENTPGVGTYEIGPMEVERGMQNSVAIALGVEGRPAGDSMPLSVAAGVAYETAAVTDEHLSVMTVDGDKMLYAAGFGYAFGDSRVFLSFAYADVSDRTVSPDVGKAKLLTPIRDDTQGAPLESYVNWGTYQTSWFVIGAGVSSEF